MSMKSAMKRSSTSALRQGALSRDFGGQNLFHLATRLISYSEACEERLVGLRRAIAAGDGAQVETLAHALTDYTLKIGALNLMKLCIALQMVGRRGLFPKANLLLDELELEYGRFKESLIPAVG